MANTKRFSALLLLSAALAACGGSEAPRNTSTISGLKTLTVGAADGANGRSWDGTVQAVQQVTLSAQTTARVSEVNYDVGDHVAAGAVLLRMTAVEQRAGVDMARAQLNAAEAGVAEAEATYRRYAALAEKQYVSKLQMDQVRTARDAAVAARNAAQASLTSANQNEAYTTVRAPFAGIVASRNVEPGESVVFGGNLIAGQTLMTVFAPESLRIEVSVPETDAAAIRSNPVAHIAFNDGRTLDATQVTVFPRADAGTHSVSIRIQLPSLDPAPMPGSTAKVSFAASKGAALPRIPLSALMRRGEVNAVYVLANNQLALRQLRLGEQGGDEIEVISGLKPGETIAADPVAAMQALAALRK